MRIIALQQTRRSRRSHPAAERGRSPHMRSDALLTYGASDVDVAREVTRALDKILKGANAGDLPVERPMRLPLVINLKTAKALGLTVPPSLLLRADHVIQ